jgi:hypothetical protein
MGIPSWFRFLTPSARLMFPELAQVLFRSRRRPHKGRPGLECCLLGDRTAPPVLVAISADALAGTWVNATIKTSIGSQFPLGFTIQPGRHARHNGPDHQRRGGPARGYETGSIVFIDTSNL